MSRRRSLPFVLLTGLLITSPALAATSATFPMRVIDDVVVGELAPRSQILEPVAEQIDALDSRVVVLLEDVLLPTGRRVDLDLHRISVAAEGGLLVVDEVPQVDRRIGDHVSLWSGRVVGDADSTVYLAFSMYGCRGFIRTAGEVVTLAARPKNSDDWSSTRSLFAVVDASVTPDAAFVDFCKAEEIQPMPTVKHDGKLADASFSGRGGSARSGGPLPLYECELALETDWQFYTLFGHQVATEVYAVTLYGAMQERFREQVGTILTMPYLGIYTTNNDPWVTQDQGGGSGAVLNEFAAKWGGGQAPVPADLYTMWSGANLGGGVAWVATLCNPNFGFSVSGNMGGNTQFPVVQGNGGNWDFYVAAHEVGHTFGTPHTHDYCPPLDSCAVGGCVTQQSCITNGTIMSYCHGCPGGVNNITTWFHPTAAALMRSYVENSCLQPYIGISSNVNLGLALIGSNGIPEHDITYTPLTPNDLMHFYVDKAPSNELGFLIISPNSWYLPFKGGIMVPTLDVMIPTVSDATGFDVYVAFLSPSVSYPAGVTFYSQVWYRDSQTARGFAATNAVEVEFIAP